MPERSSSLDYDYPSPYIRPVRSKLIKKKQQAIALYNNVADTPDELDFKRDDILTVIEQDTDGLKGWWLCTLGNRQGICPGNRLRLIDSHDSGCFTSSSAATSPCQSLAASIATLNSSGDIYENTSIISSTGSGTGSYSGSIGCGCNHLSYHLIQQDGTRRSWHASPNKNFTPNRYGDVYGYTSSPTPSSYSHQQQIYSNQSIYQNIGAMSTPNSGSDEFETYDVPKPATPVNYDCPRNVICRTPTSSSSPQVRFDMSSLQPLRGGCATPIQEEPYDVPRPLSSLPIQHHHNAMTSSSSNSSLSLSFSSSNRSSLANMPDYDVPRRPVRVVHHPVSGQQQQQQQQQSHISQHHSDVPQLRQFANGNSPLASMQSPLSREKALSNALPNSVPPKELPLELSSALETLAKLQSEATTAITRLLSFVAPNWRLSEKLDPVLMEVKLAAVRLSTALHDLTEFAEGALGNATCSEDRNLALKLCPLVKTLRDANKLIQDASRNIEAHGGWTLENLARSEDKSVKSTNRARPDSLDQLIACAQTLTEDVRLTTSFIQGNALLLFKRILAIGTDEVDKTKNAVQGNNSSAEWVDDYDYVSFESKDAAAKKNSALREILPHNLKDSFDSEIKSVEVTTMATSNMTTRLEKEIELTEKDKQLLRYYTLQISTHIGNLQQAIDSFLETVEKNQPPKFFIAYGKFVVVSAHNLVTNGDIVHRNISKAELREKILRCTDALSDALKTCVVNSKRAAAEFPSVTAVQKMVDSVFNISQLAIELKNAMLQAVQLTL